MAGGPGIDELFSSQAPTATQELASERTAIDGQDPADFDVFEDEISLATMNVPPASEPKKDLLDEWDNIDDDDAYEE